MIETQILRVWVTVLLTHLTGTRAKDDRGGVAEIILIGVLAAGAIAAGALVVAKMMSAGDKIPTGP